MMATQSNVSFMGWKPPTTPCQLGITELCFKVLDLNLRPNIIKVKTPDDLDALLADEEFNAAGYAQVSIHPSTPESFGFLNIKFRSWSSFSINMTLLKLLRL